MSQSNPHMNPTTTCPTCEGDGILVAFHAYEYPCPYCKGSGRIPAPTEQANKAIVDVCCGNRMFWFDKQHPSALYLDVREVDDMAVGKGRNVRNFNVKPDKQMDFRKLDLPDESFSLVVFDPPHFTTLGEKSYMGIKYGRLDPQTWREDLTKGFAECFRVLKENGVLIFKWNEYDVRLSEVLKLTPVRPLFGHPSGKTQLTHWVTFMKLPRSIIE